MRPSLVDLALLARSDEQVDSRAATSLGDTPAHTPRARSDRCYASQWERVVAAMIAVIETDDTDEAARRRAKERFRRAASSWLAETKGRHGPATRPSQRATMSW